jgi:hypothetical protein
MAPGEAVGWRAARIRYSPLDRAGDFEVTSWLMPAHLLDDAVRDPREER